MSYDNCYGKSTGGEWVWIIIAVIVIICLCGDNKFFGGLFGPSDCCGRDCDYDRC